MELKWKKVCESAQELENLFAHNRLQPMLVFGKKICLVKASDGVYAFNDRCPHNGASLSLGFCNEHDEIVCPLHRYPFNVKTGKASAGMALCMETYPVRIQDDGVYVGMKKKWWEN